MQLVCPNCGEPIPASHINIQKLAAVCPACNTVFSFEPEPAQAKLKRQKVKQPLHLELLDEADTLHMAFRTNFRLDKDASFLSNAVLSLLFTFITFITVNIYLVGQVSLLIPIIFGLVAVSFYYFLALIAYNQTHIEMNDETIRVYRKPLASVFSRVHEVSLAGVVAIRCEETAISKKEAYDTPRYAVWAEMADGRQKRIVNDVIEDYGYFIAQHLHERLHTGAELNVSRLEEVEYSDEDEQAAFSAAAMKRKAGTRDQ
jgi:hypothetical protein